MIKIFVFYFILSDWGSHVDLTFLSIGLSVVGKFFITCSYAAVYVVTPELFPTSVRNIGMGLCITGSKVASFMAPYSRVLVSYESLRISVRVNFLQRIACNGAVTT